MKKLLIIAVLMLCLPFVVFAKKPELKSATIEPTAASPGDTITIKVEFTGKAKDLKDVSFIVREYPYDYPRQYLQACEKCKKNIWMLRGPVPYEAYDIAGETIHLDFKALNKKGKEIITKGYENQYSGRTGTIKFKVK